MSRSSKYPIVRVSKRFTDNIHSRIRNLVKRELRKTEPNILILEGTPRNLNMEEYGTKFGYDVSEILDEENEIERQKFMRK